MGHFSSRSHFGVEGTVLYWHFVDVVWIALYLTLYLL
jgi:heme/copper-type cytochrome/quinol oxidase subunit 3